MGHRLEHLLPGVGVARGYRRACLREDLTAGVVVTALLIPAGMGYAQAAGLPPQAGLYATVVPLLVYALVGPSRVLVLGPDSSLAPIIAAAVVPLALGDDRRAIALGGVLALLVGAVLLLGGVLRLGLVTDLLSKPIRIGYLNGIALVVVVGQLPKLLGFSIGTDSPLQQVAETARGIADGRTEPMALAFGLGSLLVILGLRLLAGHRVAGRIPGVLVAVVVSTALVAALGWRARLPVVGALPAGLPAPELAGVTWRDVGALTGPALGIALIAFADTGVLSRTLAARRGDSVDGSHEMGAIGVANLASGLTGGFPVSASSSRSAVADQAGGRTQLVGVVGALLVTAFVLAAPGVTGYLPSATLAAVVIVAAAGLVDVPGFVRLLRTSPVEGLLSLAALGGIVLVGVLRGIVVAVALSFLAFVQQAWRPYRAELGLVPGVRGYHDVSRNPAAERIPGLVIVRFDAPLFFANGRIFDDYVRAVVDAAAGPVSTVILAAEPITDVDATAVDELVELDDHLASRGIRLVIAEMKDPVRDRLHRLGLDERFGPDRFAPTVGAAVDDVTGRFRNDLG
ncbi:SulP family inorganic anion transporter [Cellulomonas sp. SG140]|uniref:SulP family inorganic anion transporter n=1 Tax=Cellulomonas sp. SG140 TaxID=2976536 RepID=UPI0021E8EF84|nr:SulP family inorganic anion transporter [Cellulomonas sp. SG140]